MLGPSEFVPFEILWCVLQDPECYSAQASDLGKHRIRGSVPLAETDKPVSPANIAGPWPSPRWPPRGVTAHLCLGPCRPPPPGSCPARPVGWSGRARRPRGPAADLMPSCCRARVGRGGSSGRSAPAGPLLQKPAESWAHALRPSQAGPFAPKARKPAAAMAARDVPQRAGRPKGRGCEPGRCASTAEDSSSPGKPSRNSHARSRSVSSRRPDPPPAPPLSVPRPFPAPGPAPPPPSLRKPGPAALPRRSAPRPRPRLLALRHHHRPPHRLPSTPSGPAANPALCAVGPRAHRRRCRLRAARPRPLRPAPPPWG